MTERDTPSGLGVPPAPSEDDQALLERIAKREERRQRRMMEALDRQKEVEATPEPDLGHSRQEEELVALGEQEHEEPMVSMVEDTEEEVKPRRSYLREQESIERSYMRNEVREKPKRSFSREEEAPEEKPKLSLRKDEAGEKKPSGDLEHKMDNSPQAKQSNGGFHDDSEIKHRKPERTLSRSSVRSMEAEEEQDDAARQEAERKLEELRRRRDESESEEFERMRQRQQEAEAELEELKKKREERRKVLEEEEKLKKQELEEKKAKEEEERRRMKEEIERRRAEAAEKRHRVEESTDGESRKPFQCLGPRGASMKIGERAEFLNKSTQKSSVKMSHIPVVSKIDNRLEQYTTAAQTNKEPKAPRAAAIDLPLVTDGVRNIKSMWEKGNVFSSPGAQGPTNKEAAGMKIGVAGRINDWLNKVPESGRTMAGRPADLRPGDVTSKRSLWESKSSATNKVIYEGKSKSASNGGMGH